MGALIIGAAALAAVLCIFYLYLTWTFGYWKKRGVPYLQPEIIFGNFKETILFRASEGISLKKLYNQLEGHRFGGFFQFRTPVLLLRDPELIKTILVKDFDSFHDRFLIPVDEGTDPLSAHLFNLEGTRWRALRAKLTPTFTSGKLKMLFQLMEVCGVQLREYLAKPARQGEELEMRDVLARFTTDIIGTCAFGLQFNSMEDPKNEFREVGRNALESSPINVIRRLTIVFLNPIAKLLGLTFFGKEVSKFFLNAVKETVNYREEKNVQRKDFLQLLIEIRNKGQGPREDAQHDKYQTSEDKIKMTDNFLAAQVVVFFLAGFETSSTAMSFTLLELALNPEIQEKAREEIDTVTEKYDGKITQEALHQMTYLDKVFSESLRKYPPLTSLMRKCTKKYKIPDTNIVLEKGTRVFIPLLGLHHDPQYYPDPERFDPERFTEENKASRHHYTYLPFGEGPRVCIGMRFAMLQAKLGLATLLKSYQFTPCERTVVPIREDPTALTSAAIDGIWLKIAPRN